MSQPGVELARGFALDSFALTKELRSSLKVSGSGRRLVELGNGCQQFRQLVLGEFFVEQGLLAAFVLQGFLVALTICFSAMVHIAIPAAAQGGFGQDIVADQRLLHDRRHGTSPSRYN